MLKEILLALSLYGGLGEDMMPEPATQSTHEKVYSSKKVKTENKEPFIRFGTDFGITPPKMDFRKLQMGENINFFIRTPVIGQTKVDLGYTPYKGLSLCVGMSKRVFWGLYSELCPVLNYSNKKAKLGMKGGWRYLFNRNGMLSPYALLETELERGRTPSYYLGMGVTYNFGGSKK